jgi:hypothetical protein
VDEDEDTAGSVGSADASAGVMRRVASTIRHLALLWFSLRDNRLRALISSRASELSIDDALGLIRGTVVLFVGSELIRAYVREEGRGISHYARKSIEKVKSVSIQPARISGQVSRQVLQSSSQIQLSKEYD